MILLKLCAAISLIFSIVLGFELLVDVICFGGARLSNGQVQNFGTTLGFGLLFLAMLVTSLEGLFL